MMYTNNILLVAQQNVGRSQLNVITILKNARSTGVHVVCAQEVKFLANGNPPSIYAFTSIVPNYYTGAKPRVVIYWRNNSPFKYQQINHLCDDPDIIVLSVTGPGLQEFKLVNIYNEKRYDEVIGEGHYTIERSLQYLNI